MATTTKTKKKVELPPNPFLFEILELASKQRAKAKKVEVLQEYENDALKASLFGTLMRLLLVLFLRVRFRMQMVMINLFTQEPYLKIWHGKQRVESLRQDKIWTVEVRLRCVENIKISTTL